MKRFLLFLFVVTLAVGARAQRRELLRLTVEAGNNQRVNTPVSYDLSGISIADTLSLQLYESVKGKLTEVPSQIEEGYIPRLWWILSGITPAGAKREYVLYQEVKKKTESAVSVVANSEIIRLIKDGKPVLDYTVKIVYPPAGVDTMYKRNGFIHPMYSPSGNILTRINAPDHYHHFGIWNPWTRVRIRNHVTDFWNLYTHQGTVRYAGINSITSGPVFSGFDVRHEHVDYQGKKPEEITFNEVWDVRVWSTEPITDAKAWLVDLTSFLSVAGDTAIILEAYRYGGGIGFRATAEWHNKNSWVVTSEGKTRVDADGTRARWTDVGGAFEGKGESGIVFFSHPSNREHPEPMRVWPVDQNGRGDVYFEFCPIRHKEWILEPGNVYRLKYRMLVYDGRVDKASAERIWTDFAAPPVVKATVK
ncbi:MAG: PmoA family protein [Bacteroidales bacterium]